MYILVLLCGIAPFTQNITHPDLCPLIVHRVHYHTLVSAWPMAGMLWRLFEYYYFYYSQHITSVVAAGNSFVPRDACTVSPASASSA